MMTMIVMSNITGSATSSSSVAPSMRTIKDIEREEQSVMKVFDEKYTDKKLEKKERKKASRRLAFLRFVKTYLEFNPSYDSVTRQLTDVNKRLDLIESQFDLWKKANPDSIKCKDPKATYYAEVRRSYFLKQQKTLRYILNHTDAKN